MPISEQISSWDVCRDRRLLNAVDGFEKAARTHGISLILDDDFRAFKRFNKCLDKLALTPNFDPDTSTLDSRHGFWMKGVDRMGRIVMTQAARQYDCNAISVAGLHETLRAFYTDPGDQAETGEVCRSRAPAAYAIAGNVCYHGELWLAPPYRGRGLTDPLPKLLMALVLLKWAPSYLFGMAQPGIVIKGVAQRYGYRNMQPGGMIWTVPSRGTLDEWIIWNDLDQLYATVMQA